LPKSLGVSAVKRNQSAADMKSAYELAMERLNKTAPAAKLTNEQKQRLAELDAEYKAKIADREIFLQGQMAKAVEAGDEESLAQLRRQLANDRKNFQEELEEKKEAVRKGQA
jgi:hypothetical protein